MKTSLVSRILSDNDADASLLDAWLAERDADLALRKVPDSDDSSTVDVDRLRKAVSPYDADVRPGQIRILSPKFVSDDDAIPYVAVLDRWMEDLWLVAPYSPYSFPASTGEMATRDPIVGRRVLQCWNVRTAHESLVAQSRLAGSLDDSVRQDALALFRHVTAGTDLPESFQALVGPPVLSKVDPRCEFLSESAARYEPLTAAACETEAALARAERFAAFRSAIAERLAAAIDRFKDLIRVPAYGIPAYALASADKPLQTTETFRVPSRGVELDVKYTPSEGKVRLVVYRNGELDASSLEGFVVADKDASPVGEILNGVLVADSAALKDGFLLVDPDTMEPIPCESSKKEGK